jgi:acetyltransferase
MLAGIRGHAVLNGVRGAPPEDRRALEDILLRISQLAEDFPEIRELDLNPVMAFGDRAVAVDGRVLIE